MRSTLRIITRQSALALKQAQQIQQNLTYHHPDIHFTIIPTSTIGDKITDRPIQSIGGKDVFIKELQQKLLSEEADIAVHCVKDLSVFHHPDLAITCTPLREAAHDALLTHNHSTLKNLKKNAIIGTGSPRRASLIKHIRPDLQIKPIRGNIDTRINKLIDKQYDGIILAQAGLNRLNLSEHISDRFSTDHFTPAIGQGALGLDHRSDDLFTRDIISCLNDPETHTCIKAEQEVNKILRGDCHSCIGAYAKIEQGIFRIEAMVGCLSGQTILRASRSGPAKLALEFAHQVATNLIEQGALELLQSSQKDL